MLRSLLAVAMGAAVGTGLRLGVELAMPAGAFAVASLVINVSGSFALGLLVARVWPLAPEWLRAGLGAGLLGSFTTFSAVAVTLVSFAADEKWMLALGYLAATVGLGFAAAWLGLRVGRTRTAPS